jgi:predicted GIY-YIG superfamily endonuclease
MVEQSAVNRWVVGSSPTSGANFGVYILENPAGRFYVGHTDDLARRLEATNRTDSIKGQFTRKNGPWKPVWSEHRPRRSSAMAREHQSNQ